MIFRHSLDSRNLSLVILRCMAAFLITQSHVEALLPSNLKALVVGADIGDALFFFCAGYALFLGRSSNGFVDWYSRKVSRIYPSFLVMALLTAFVFGVKLSFQEVVTFHGYWFVQALMIYFAVLYFVKRYFIHHLRVVFVILYVALMMWGGAFPFGERYQLWGHFKFFSVLFLPMMTMGAIVGYEEKTAGVKSWNVVLCMIVAIASLAVHYGTKIAISAGCFGKHCQFQLVFVAALFVLVLALYKYFQRSAIREWMLRSWFGKAIYFVSSLTLEIYIVNSTVIGWASTIAFPYNLPVAYLDIVAAAFVLKCATNLFLQFVAEHKICLRELFVVD